MLLWNDIFKDQSVMAKYTFTLFVLSQKCDVYYKKQVRNTDNKI